tara:strand:- start:50 stop:646 length:597 start_codon:yes stop_codon:yes gene_type:complete
MKGILFILLSFILGLLTYQIIEDKLKCGLIEGYGLFGRVNLEKCCPLEYKFSKKLNKCVRICQGCDISAYGNLKYEDIAKKRNDSFTLATYYDCDENNANKIYDYSKINRRYSKRLNQYDINGTISDSDVKGSEEGNNESWASINMSIPTISTSSGSASPSASPSSSSSSSPSSSPSSPEPVPSPSIQMNLVPLPSPS